MQNQRAVEAVYSATYVEDYMDAIENLPDEIQRQLTRIREMDIDSQNYITDVKSTMAQLLELEVRGVQTEDEQRVFMSMKTRVQRLLMSIQEIGDEKIQIAQQIQDYVENRVRQLELDKKTLEHSNRPEPHTHEPTTLVSTSSATVRETSTKTGENTSEGRTLKRARRARLDPSIHAAPAVKAASSTHQSIVNEKRVETYSLSTSVSVPTPSSSVSVPTQVPGTPITAQTQSVTQVASTSTTPVAKPARTPATASNATSGKRDHEASTSTPASSSHTEKKRTESTSGISGSEAVERKSESSSTRTPKKHQHEKKQQKAAKKQATASTTKKRNSRQVDDSPPMNLQADPDEPTYCLCDQVSYGDMIGCDNDLCPIEVRIHIVRSRVFKFIFQAIHMSL